MSTKCPACGSDKAYVGFTDVKCPEFRCQFFDMKQALPNAMENHRKWLYGDEDETTDPFEFLLVDLEKDLDFSD